jgi:hypothetical protein
MAGQAVPVAPSIRVRDGAGNATPGVTVVFTVTAGGGSTQRTTAVTNDFGIANAGAWTLGGTGALNTLTASVAGGGFNTITFNAAGCEGGGGGGYAITVCYQSNMTASQRTAFVNAAAKWGAVITGDVPDIALNLNAGDCATNTQSLNMTVDDVLIFAAVVPIDGSGGILGSAGPCYVRAGSLLPVAGIMKFDSADLASMESGGYLQPVILHEMGHVLGVGTLWSSFGYLQNPSPIGGPALDTYFSGANGIAGFNAIGGSTYTGGQKVPVENSFGSGTINAHWREGVLGNELMTGFIGAGSNPLSALTARSLQDIGYVVNPAAADPFFLSLSFRADEEGPLIDLRNDSHIGPLRTVNPLGRVQRIR